MPLENKAVDSDRENNQSTAGSDDDDAAGDNNNDDGGYKETNFSSKKVWYNLLLFLNIFAVSFSNDCDASPQPLLRRSISVPPL